MSDKCKLLVMPSSEGCLLGDDGLTIEELWAAIPPVFEFEFQGTTGSGARRPVRASVVGGAQVSLEPERRLAAVVRVEVVNVPLRIACSRQRTAMAWAKIQERFLQALVERCRGRFLQRSGLAATLEFSSVRAALEFAMETQDQLGEPAKCLPGETVGVRIDIDVGDFVDVEELWPGTLRDVEPRMACSRRAGEIWVTDRVFAFVVDDIEVRSSVMARGEGELRLERGVRLYEVRKRH